MPSFTNAMEVFNLLEKSNCRKCGEKTCLAFAGAVFMSQKQLSDCPLLTPDIVAKYGVQENKSAALEDDSENILEQLRTRLQKIDLEAKAESLGAIYGNNKLTLKIMGKDFSIDDQGKVYTNLHVNSWLLVSTFNYIIHCRGTAVTGNWVPLRELPSGKDWYRLFGQQCEKQLKKTADTYPDLFSDLVHIFSGRQVADQFQSDIGVILSPLPLVPMLICYWKPEEGMDSSLNLFFDNSAEENIGMDGLYLLGVGIARMLEKLAHQHGGLTGK